MKNGFIRLAHTDSHGPYYIPTTKGIQFRNPATAKLNRKGRIDEPLEVVLKLVFELAPHNNEYSIADRMGIPVSKAMYHLEVLEQSEYIVSHFTRHAPEYVITFKGQKYLLDFGLL